MLTPSTFLLTEMLTKHYFKYFLIDYNDPGFRSKIPVCTNPSQAVFCYKKHIINRNFNVTFLVFGVERRDLARIIFRHAPLKSAHEMLTAST